MIFLEVSGVCDSYLGVPAVSDSSHSTVYKFTSYCLLLSISKLEHEWGQCCGAVPICPGSISVSYSLFSETFLKNQFNSKKLAGAACVFRLHVEKIGSSQRDRLRAASAPQHFMRLHVCLWMGTANHWSNLWASFYPLPPPNKKMYTSFITVPGVDNLWCGSSVCDEKDAANSPGGLS